jgi:hypothetical protein
MAPDKKNPQALAAALLCGLGTALLFILPISNPDLFWHLGAAKKIFADMAFPRADWLSHTMRGEPWANFEWLTQIIWFAHYKLAGYWGLWALKVALYTSCAVVLWRGLELYTQRLEPRGIALIVWALSIMPANDLRPENFSLLFFLSLWFALERRRLRKGKGSAWLIPPLFALWGNLHAGFVYGLVLLGLFALGELIRSRGKQKTLVYVGLACAVAPLLNPYGYQVYAVPLQHAAELGQLQEYLKEWQSASVLSVWLWPFWTLLAASFAVVLHRYIKKRDIPGEHLAALVLFSLSGVSHVRTSVYFSCIAVPIVAAALRLKGGAAKAAIAMVFAGAYAYLLTLALQPLKDFSPFSPRFVPVGATQFLSRQRGVLGGKKLFNPWHWGGFLSWQLYPDYPVFYDGRYIFHSLLKPYHEAARDPKTYQEYFKANGVEVALLRVSEQYVQMPIETKKGKSLVKRPFYLFYLPKSQWALVYWDTKALVFVRRENVDAAWLADHEYRWFRPQDREAVVHLLADGHIRPEVLAAEMGRYAGINPRISRGAKEWLDHLMRGAP